ncbi:hypothetical protein [Chitinophaga pinensis]|uniref:Uncharacterized protein n=1 Tax=Chitinophaga pinensis (strain ATCC 43595 / DSM 2588 / LMG 13176 / NBRC 15968 / NCIMB 11800 / UQM 2034) TaxID=485918 RepID=A0A979G820_CHIPD|nr:hypothetical protein [Chitinophaga pinensis]ACU62609.1 hypothetical protein Cpin_5178 [Chitinophaga pinensis DSM 2588]
MKKGLTGFFLTLFFLLIGVYHQSYARTSHDDIGCTLRKVFENPEYLHLATTYHRHGLHKTLHAPGKSKKNYIKIYAADNEEDDDIASFKKALEIPRDLTAFFADCFTDYSSQQTIQGLAANKPLSYLPADRYILFLVIRI